MSKKNRVLKFDSLENRVCQSVFTPPPPVKIDRPLPTMVLEVTIPLNNDGEWTAGGGGDW